MIVVSAGMPKAGSGWYFNLTNDLLIAAGHQDVRSVRDRFHLDAILKHHNCLIGRPILPRLALLGIPHLMSNTFVVKTHSGPTPSLRYLMTRNVARATYIYRDPRDAALSAYNHGQRLREKGHEHTFARLETMEMTIFVAREWLQTWEQWTRLENVLVTRYEDLLADPLNEAKRLSRFLSLGLGAEDLVRIVEAYQMDGAPEKDSHLSQGLHFHKGRIGRFREVLTGEELALCNEQFGSRLRNMGYPLE